MTAPRRSSHLLPILLAALCVPTPSAAQQDSSEIVRKITNRVVPAYPALARSMRLVGTVKMEAVVNPSGSVRHVSVKGGNPVLVQAANKAVMFWKFEPGSRETVEQIEIKFNP